MTRDLGGCNLQYLTLPWVILHFLVGDYDRSLLGISVRFFLKIPPPSLVETGHNDHPVFLLGTFDW